MKWYSGKKKEEDIYSYSYNLIGQIPMAYVYCILVRLKKKYFAYQGHMRIQYQKSH